MPRFCPSFCSFCPLNHNPESLGTGVSPLLGHTIGKLFPDPQNCLPSTNPDPLFFYILLGYTQESVCVMFQEEDETCRKPSHKTWEQNDVNTGPSWSSLCEDPSPHMLPWVKWLKHSQKGGSHLSWNAWTHSFFNTAVHPTLFNIRNIGLEKASWNHLHHSLLKQSKHYLDTKGISPDCSIVLSLTTKHLAAFFHCMFSSMWNPTWFHIDEITDFNFSSCHISQIVKG